MYINLSTLAACSEHDVRIQNPLTTFPVPFATPEGYAQVIQLPRPDFNESTHAAVEGLPRKREDGQWEQQWEVYALTAEQIEVKQEAKAIADAKAIEGKVEALWAAADRYTSGYISGVAVGILTIGVMQQKPKALAVTAWSSSIWSEYYARKALINLGSVDNHDFSEFGPIPYSVPELQVEAGL